MQKQPFTINVINSPIKVAVPSGVMNAFDTKIRQSIKAIANGHYISRSNQIISVDEDVYEATVFIFFSENQDESIQLIKKMVNSILTFDKAVFVECGVSWNVFVSKRKV